MEENVPLLSKELRARIEKFKRKAERTPVSIIEIWEATSLILDALLEL